MSYESVVLKQPLLVATRRVQDVVRLEAASVLRGEVARQLRVVDGREVEEEVVGRRRIVPQEESRLLQRHSVRDERRDVGPRALFDRHALAELLLENRTERNGGRSESRAHRSPSPAAALAFASSSDSAVSPISGSSFLPGTRAMTPSE